jgi:two-component system chemotaxis response regulator CheY
MKKVLCGISHYPEKSNKMLAKLLSVNTSTISTSRQRLNERELISKEYVPKFYNVDMGLIMIASGKYRYQFPKDVRETIIGFISHPATPFFISSDNTSWLVMGFVPPENNDLMRERISTLSDQYMYEMTFDVNKIWFDCENVNVSRYFDYGHLLCKTLNVKITSRSHSNTSFWSIDELKKNDKTIIQSLINDSQPSDFQRSQKLGISHPTITKIRKSLVERGVIKTLIKPNLNSFGFSIFAWFNLKLEGKEVEKNLLMALCSDPNNILCINDTDNVLIISVFLDMKDLLQGQQRLNEFMSKTMISYDNISFNYFSLDNPSFNMNLSPRPATRIFETALIKNKKGIYHEDELQQLSTILKKYFSEEEVSNMSKEIKDSLRLEDTKRSASAQIVSMILELLTEPKYLFSLEKTERTALQATLIEKLNNLRLKIDSQGQFEGQGKKRRIMIVEDSKPMSELLNDIFEEENFNVVSTVDNGQGAFDNYRNLCENNNRPDVVLMDIFLKGINGVEATKMIKDYDPTACIVVLTSSLDSKIKTRLTSMGVDEYLIKPVTKVQLINSLEQSMAKRKG